MDSPVFLCTFLKETPRMSPLASPKKIWIILFPSLLLAPIHFLKPVGHRSLFLILFASFKQDISVRFDYFDILYSRTLIINSKLARPLKIFERKSSQFSIPSKPLSERYHNCKRMSRWVITQYLNLNPNKKPVQIIL